jgi:hypothetical protein
MVICPCRGDKGFTHKSGSVLGASAPDAPEREYARRQSREQEVWSSKFRKSKVSAAKSRKSKGA